jgi:hypothetical protein
MVDPPEPLAFGPAYENVSVPVTAPPDNEPENEPLIKLDVPSFTPRATPENVMLDVVPERLNVASAGSTSDVQPLESPVTVNVPVRCAEPVTDPPAP